MRTACLSGSGIFVGGLFIKSTKKKIVVTVQVWFCMVWYGIVWYGMECIAWLDLVKYGMV